jgi:hypothetical protein
MDGSQADLTFPDGAPVLREAMTRAYPVFSPGSTHRLRVTAFLPRAGDGGVSRGNLFQRIGVEPYLRSAVRLFGCSAVRLAGVSVVHRNIYLFYTRALVSVWCFFAAILSVLIFVH